MRVGELSHIQEGDFHCETYREAPAGVLSTIYIILSIGCFCKEDGFDSHFGLFQSLCALLDFSLDRASLHVIGFIGLYCAAPTIPSPCLFPALITIQSTDSHVF